MEFASLIMQTSWISSHTICGPSFFFLENKRWYAIYAFSKQLTLMSVVIKIVQFCPFESILEYLENCSKILSHV